MCVPHPVFVGLKNFRNSLFQRLAVTLQRGSCSNIAYCSHHFLE
jgi:hypothetical protein